MTDPIAFRASKRNQAREEKEYRIRERVRKTLDTAYVETDQPLQPFTGDDHSSRSISNAVSFWLTHELPDWMARGSCREYSQEMFYGSEDREGKARHHPNLTVDEVARARRVCNTCPVQMECLDFAIRTREEFGIWGGSTAGQRKRWIKQFEERHLVLVDDSEIDLTSYDEVYGGYGDDVEDLEHAG
jgi:WhiB family redox-sensing transcriptional regulator